MDAQLTLIKILLAPRSVSSAPSHYFKLMSLDFEPSTEVEKEFIFLVFFRLVLTQSKPRRKSSIFVLPKKVEIGKSISLLQKSFLLSIVATAGKIALKDVINSSWKPVEIAHLADRSSMNTQMSYLRRSSCLNCFTVLLNYHSFYHENRENLRVAIQTVILGKHSTNLSD